MFLSLSSFLSKNKFLNLKKNTQNSSLCTKGPKGQQNSPLCSLDKTRERAGRLVGGAAGPFVVQPIQALGVRSQALTHPGLDLCSFLAAQGLLWPAYDLKSW